jgi:hypothetical protein
LQPGLQFVNPFSPSKVLALFFIVMSLFPENAPAFKLDQPAFNRDRLKAEKLIDSKVLVRSAGSPDPFAAGEDRTSRG